MTDQVDSAATQMFVETTTYVLALNRGETPDPTAMSEATQAYRRALKASLEEELRASLEEDEVDRRALPMTVVDDPDTPPWGDDRSCPDCGEPDLPLRDSKPPGLTFISHCGELWIRGPMKMATREAKARR